MRSLIKSSPGRKILMAVSGQVMILFVIAHVLGNSTMYFGGLNDYAQQLHALPPLLWLTRVIMLIMLVTHVVLGIQLTLENRTAGADTYAVRRFLRTTFAARTMIWTGLIIGAFLVYHLLHFTFQVTNPLIAARSHLDALGRPDVLRMVVMGLQNTAVSLTYGISMIALFLHLTHGIQSSFQSLGLNNERAQRVIAQSGMAAAWLLFFGYIAIPVVIILGMIRG